MSRLLAACLLAAIFLSPSVLAKGTAHHRVGLILHDGVRLTATPDLHGRILTSLVQQTQVEVLKAQRAWYHVRIWASVTGWVPKKEVVFRKPWSTVSTYRAPETHSATRAYGSAGISAAADTTSPVTIQRSPGGAPTISLGVGSRVQVSAWQQDARGKVWYRVQAGWALGDAIAFRRDASRHSGQPLWHKVAGKGMWLTLGTVTDSSPASLVEAARKSGVTHLYVESAISPLGFHGRSSVPHLIDAAHQAHIAVIAWVYPYLEDVASDVTLTRQVAAFRTSNGVGFDGIAADLERNIHSWNVRAYSQLIRAYLGDDYLLVGVTYPPQSFPDFPYLEVARSYDLIAPMDYWHQTQTAFGLDYGHMRYGSQYAYRYASDSVSSIRQTGVRIPIAPIGQTFDDFGRLEMGPHAPSRSEIDGFLEGSKTSGAVGVSFFQWMTASIGEWRAIQRFQF